MLVRLGVKSQIRAGWEVGRGQGIGKSKVREFSSKKGGGRGAKGVVVCRRRNRRNVRWRMRPTEKARDPGSQRGGAEET